MTAPLSITASPPPPSAPVITALLPIMAVVVAVFLVVGIAVPVIPLYVHRGLGLGTFVVGLVAGSQFAAALLSRVWAGNYSDVRGPKRAIVIGLLTAAVSGLLYVLSLNFTDRPWLSVTILLIGRGLIGAAESLIITGAQIWGLVLGGPQNTSKVMAWVGMGLFAAFAIGAPIGAGLYAACGFVGIALATIAVPLLTLLLVLPLAAATPPERRVRPRVATVIGAVMMPGLGAALSNAGFGAMITFVVLLFAERGWSPSWLPFTIFAAALIAARLWLSHLADRLGGARVALVFVLIEAAGLLLIGLAQWPAMALVGSAATGFGYALVYPGFAVEAIRRIPAESRGLALGFYTAFLDLALALAGPVFGLIAAGAGLSAVFLASALVVLSATIIAVRLLKAAPLQSPA